MTLAAGTRLGPYEVVAPLGAGGMGEVWRGRDTRLERSVAIKVLPAEFAQNAQFKLRFEREAKTISQLNHPHICTLYDVGDGYLVMELLEGETLADRVARGPLPVAEVLKYGVQIAQALDKAHKAGVVHRDLKPGNVMITKSGAKLLDFGLAKPAEGGVLNALTSLRTEKRNLTEEGTIVGTVQYMAPEQIEGGEVDARTDIFALGALLYEMATGRRAFEGKSKASLIASILTAEPQPINAVQPMTPASFDRLVRNCLNKDPDDRWQSAHDVATELRWIGEAPSTTVRQRRGRDGITWALLAALLVATGTFAYLWRHAATASAPRLEASILPPENYEFAFTVSTPAVSPDGSLMAFTARSKLDSKIHLFIRRLDNGALRDAAVESPGMPFWSPDSRSVAFFNQRDRKLERIDASGGPPQVICDTNGRGSGGTWNSDGVILFSSGVRGGLNRVPASGGTPVEVTKLDPAHETVHRWPSFLPDGKHFLYSARTFGYPESGRIYVGSLDSSDRKLLLRNNLPARYSPPGHLLYARDRALVAQPFDVKKLELLDEATVVADNIYTYGLAGSAAFAPSSNGVLAFQRGSGERSQLIWRDRTGKQLGTIGDVGDYVRPALARDGRQVAYEVYGADGKSDIWIYDMARQTSTRFTFDAGSETNAVWSADDRSILYSSEDLQRGGRNIIRRDARGGDSETLFKANGVAGLTSWSSDGRHIFFHDGNDVFYYSTADRKVIPVVQTPFIDCCARLSPDGRFLAYGSEKSGTQEIYVQPFPNATAVWKVSTSGGTQPRWTANGREIIFENNDRKVYSVEIHAGQTFDAGVPKELFSYRFKPGGWPLDVSADGQRFLINEAVRDQNETPVTLVLNWAAGLKK